jgi:hypothetical protein
VPPRQAAEVYTLADLADKILIARAALQGERQPTAPFLTRLASYEVTT